MGKSKKHSKSVLKWKLISVFVTMVIITDLAVLLWVRLSFEQYVRNAEIKRFKDLVKTTLGKKAKDYRFNSDHEQFNSTLSDLITFNPEIEWVFLSESDGKVDRKVIGGDSAGAAAVFDKADVSYSGDWNSLAIDTSREVVVDGRKYIMTSYKGKVDPYAMHFAFSLAPLEKRTSDLILKVTLVVLLTSAVTVLVGSAFLLLIARPVERLARDAEKLSLGDMEVRLRHRSRSEVGRIYKSLARLKESILYSMKRLDMR